MSGGFRINAKKTPVIRISRCTPIDVLSLDERNRAIGNGLFAYVTVRPAQRRGPDGILPDRLSKDVLHRRLIGPSERVNLRL